MCTRGGTILPSHNKQCHNADFTKLKYQQDVHLAETYEWKASFPVPLFCFVFVSSWLFRMNSTQSGCELASGIINTYKNRSAKTHRSHPGHILTLNRCGSRQLWETGMHTVCGCPGLMSLTHSPVSVGLWCGHGHVPSHMLRYVHSIRRCGSSVWLQASGKEMRRRHLCPKGNRLTKSGGGAEEARRLWGRQERVGKDRGWEKCRDEDWISEYH